MSVHPAVARTDRSAQTGPPYRGIKVVTNGNELVAYYTEARLAEAGVFYPITPSTEQGENFERSFAQGELNVFGDPKIAIEAEGEHAAQGGAIALSVTGKRVVNFTSGQGVLYGLEQFYHAPGKLSTMVLEVAARALTKHALNVHCGHDDIYAALDTGWIILFAKDAQQAADQALILRWVNELALTPGINAQDGFLTSHLERTFLMPEAGLIREFLGWPDDIVECPTQAQRELFGPTRRRVPECFDLKNPALLGSVQNQEHYMMGVAARRHHFVEPILGFLEEAYEEFARLTGRHYGLISEYDNDHNETTIVALGSAAENCEAAVDYIKQTEGDQVGVLHVNVLRPFPEKSVIKALAGKKRVIVLERMDDQTAGDGPLARDIRTALLKAREHERYNAHGYLPKLDTGDLPRIFSGVYGLGSRDFRPEAILGAYEFATGKTARQDGRRADEGASFFYLGINHPYGVESQDKPSLLPEGAIAVRFHSIGGWGMITTGKNLGEILGELGQYIARRDHPDDLNAEALHINANPKYGSEKKGAPTNYFLVAAPQRIRVNCDLRHVSVELCCDPKVFTHTNPLVGLQPGGAFVWESSEDDPKDVWQRIPRRYRQEIIDKDIRIYALNGFKIAYEATDRPELQFRMQGNAFLGAFFKVSTFLQDNDIPEQEFLSTVRGQYKKKFGRLGDAVVESNMTVMQKGFETLREIPHGELDAPDRSSMRGETIVPLSVRGAQTHWTTDVKSGRSGASEVQQRPPLMALSAYDAEFRSDYGYNQPSTPHAATGAIAAATGRTASKYVARRQTPIFIAENCTQCMACIVVCPDSAMPNTAQEIGTVLRTALSNYVSNADVRDHLLADVDQLEHSVREVMKDYAAKKNGSAKGIRAAGSTGGAAGSTGAPASFSSIVAAELDQLITRAAGPTAGEAGLSPLRGAGGTWYRQNGQSTGSAVAELKRAIEKIPFAYAKTHAIFRNKEKKQAGAGGVFGIFINDLCKGCGECVVECGDHQALVMVDETEQVNGDHETGIAFLDKLPNTSDQYLGLYDPLSPEESRTAALQFHLMQRSKYEVFASGDGACAGCGEKSILRAIATVTEAYMRPVYHAKADRLTSLADRLESEGSPRLEQLKADDPQAYRWWRKSILHVIMGYGGENDRDTDARIASEFEGQEGDLIAALKEVLRHDAFCHRDLQAVDGGEVNGMSVMAMTACTGCNTVYGSTHPNNPHPYPWMNSLFQDGATIGWLVAEGFIMNHAKRSVVPERLARALLDGDPLDENDYWTFCHFTDAQMSDLEIAELPKVWAVGGDGGLGDIGFQNLSKVVLQNRPNVLILMLDTQVYSNTGGQNSDSSVMPGGFDMNQIGKATEGKLTEKKGVAECMISGHGSPYVVQVSMANSATLFKTILDALAYRGTAFIQAFTTCQPEHGVADDVSTVQARLARDSRCIPEFVFDPSRGESYQESLSIKGNPSADRDWYQKPLPKGAAGPAAGGLHAPFRGHPRDARQADNRGQVKYNYTVAQWAATEARFRNHFFKVKPEQLDDMINLDDILLKIAQEDIIHRRFLDASHRAFVPQRGVYTYIEKPDGSFVPTGISRQMVLFCVERRKNWRMLQSKAGVGNEDRLCQKRVLEEVDSGSIPIEVFHSRLHDVYAAARRRIQEASKTPLMELVNKG